MNILDIGSGDGTVAEQLREGGHSVFTVDKEGSPNILGDVHTINIDSIPDNLDYVLFLMPLGINIIQVCTRFREKLKESGCIYVVTDDTDIALRLEDLDAMQSSESIPWIPDSHYMEICKDDRRCIIDFWTIKELYYRQLKNSF